MPRTRGSYKQTQRALRLLGLLRDRPSGERIQELAKALRRSQPQVMRDLRALNEGGHQVIIEAEDEAPFYRRARLGVTHVSAATSTRRERYTLLAVQAMLGALAGTPFEEDGRSVFAKLTDRLSVEEQRDLTRLAKRIVFIPAGGVKDYRDKLDVFDDILTGVMLRRLVDVTRGGKTETWAPLGLALYKQGVYVVASKVKKPKDGPLRVTVETTRGARAYALERLDATAILRGSHFDEPPGFDVAHFFDGAFGVVGNGHPKRVVLHFSPRVAASVRSRTIHRTAELEPLADGGVRMVLRPTNLLELKSWVLGWGAQVEVAEPPDFRARIALEAARTAARYLA